MAWRWRRSARATRAHICARPRIACAKACFRSCRAGALAIRSRMPRAGSFAGTGALGGLEALSRGGTSVTFVDDGRKALSLIRENIAKCRAQDATQIVRRDATRLGAGEPHDLIFLDRPMARGGWGGKRRWPPPSRAAGSRRTLHRLGRQRRHHAARGRDPAGHPQVRRYADFFSERRRVTPAPQSPPPGRVVFAGR